MPANSQKASSELSHNVLAYIILLSPAAKEQAYTTYYLCIWCVIKCLGYKNVHIHSTLLSSEIRNYRCPHLAHMVTASEARL